MKRDALPAASATTFLHSEREVLLDEAEVRAFPGLEESSERLKTSCGIRYLVRPVDVWIEVPIDQRWDAWCRIVPDRVGTPVIGEIRVLPSARRGLPNGWAGRWAAEVEGHRARAPLGGVTARLAGRVRTGVVRQYIDAAIRAVHTQFRDESARESYEGDQHRPQAWLQEGAIPWLAAQADAGTQRRPGRRTRKNRSRGRPPLADVELARLADRYVTLTAQGVRAPWPQIARELGITQAAAKRRMQIAKQRGFVSRGGAGRPGGRQLLEPARTLLAVASGSALATKSAHGGLRGRSGRP